MLRIFTSVKIQRLRPGLNPETWLPEASMLTTRPPKPSKQKEGFERRRKSYSDTRNRKVAKREADMCR